MPPSSRPDACSPRCALPASRCSTPPRTPVPTACRAASPTRRQNAARDPALYAIKAEFKPQPGDVVITKQRASAFYGTPLMAHLTQLGIKTVIVCGESTSGCVRASAVDAYSNGFHVVLVEECCFDRSLLSHKVNLFDLHHKYADVLHVDDVLAHLGSLAARKAS
jgi:nicotinamidase-related amidase